MKFFADLLLIDQNKARLPNPGSKNVLQILLTDLFIIVGALAFLMLVVAGFRYILARGNPEKITQARNMIMYSLIGLIICVLASTIVNFVIERAAK